MSRPGSHGVQVPSKLRETTQQTLLATWTWNAPKRGSYTVCAYAVDPLQRRGEACKSLVIR